MWGAEEISSEKKCIDIDFKIGDQSTESKGQSYHSRLPVTPQSTITDVKIEQNATIWDRIFERQGQKSHKSSIKIKQS